MPCPFLSPNVVGRELLVTRGTAACENEKLERWVISWFDLISGLLSV
jgi:hypothetical protein